jgi:hypothetical protein
VVVLCKIFAKTVRKIMAISGISRLECLELYNVSADIAFVISRVNVCAMFAETLDNSQHSTPESWSYTLNFSRENQRTRLESCNQYRKTKFPHAFFAALHSKFSQRKQESKPYHSIPYHTYTTQALSTYLLFHKETGANCSPIYVLSTVTLT